jgi:hypothetical protein
MNHKLAQLYMKINNYTIPGGAKNKLIFQAEVYCKEAIRISSKMYGTSHPNIAKYGHTLYAIDQIRSYSKNCF